MLVLSKYGGTMFLLHDSELSTDALKLPYSFLCWFFDIFWLLEGVFAAFTAVLSHLNKGLFAMLCGLAWSITFGAAEVRNYKLCFCHNGRSIPIELVKANRLTF